MKKQLEPL